MARRINYGFEKNQKEAKRKKKQLAKLEKKRLNKENKQSDQPVEGQAPAILDADGLPIVESPPKSE